MPTPQEAHVNAQLELLLSLQFAGMDQGARVSLVESVMRINGEYGLAVELGKTSKYYNDLGESIAKSLPGIVKGALSASQAFKKGDYIAGSAALMDICASVIPVFASLASAGGPAGDAGASPAGPALLSSRREFIVNGGEPERMRWMAVAGQPAAFPLPAGWTSCNGIEVTSLSAAADGTLIVSMLHKIYTADYQIDRAASRIKTSGWFERGGFGIQVVKMPIACWPALQSLRENLLAQ